jgi:hypothetical protein
MIKSALAEGFGFDQFPQMETVSVIRPILAAFAAANLCSCASVTVKDAGGAVSGDKPLAAPKRIYVAPFSTAHASVKEHPMRKHPGQLASETQDLIAKHLVEDLSKTIAPATLVKSPAAAGRDGWIVTGDITEINEGSRILRMAIGLGAGSTKMETAVAVRASARSNRPFLTFDTKGTSGATPGGATNPIPFSGVPTALLAGQQGISDDAARTARMITSRIADYMVQHGWKVSGTVPKTKMATR